MRDENDHPDLGELEAYRGGEADAVVAAHIERCPSCQAALSDLEQLVAWARAELEDDAGSPYDPATIPEEINRRMVWNAHQNAARVRRQLRSRTWQRWAIAASLLLCVATALLWRQSDSGPLQSAGLNVVDALALAKQLAAAQPAQRRYDVNLDGHVDESDVEAILRHAVALGDA